ncbi:carbon-nitrogen hydrolase family protein [bacterium]|nr:carbon-nitrogen hydrolase family protein [bacterium]
MKISIAQVISHADLEKNLRSMEQFVSTSKQAGAEIVIFPEMAYFSGKKPDWKPVTAQFKEITGQFCELAKKYSVALIPGTVREPSPNPDKFFNTLLFIDEKGTVLTQYRKLFLYKANLTDRSYDETEYSTEGCEIVTVSWHGITWGLAICFDLRFPELFRSLKKRGAQVVVLPSAFTVPTGQAHWEVLIRARAIENQLFFVAPGLTGISGDGSAKYGHSIAVSPWGNVIENLGDSENTKSIEIDLSEISTAESKVPAWNCRREELFKIS